VVDPASPQARSASETQLVQQLVSRGAQTFFDPNRGIRVVSGGQTPNIPSLAASLPGFTIVADWKSSTNFDLSVTRTSIIPSETIFPVKGLDRYPNGDHTPFDHRGGPSGGFEYANFPTADLNSAFDIGITNHGGAEGTATVRAFLNGRPQNVLNGDFVPLPSQTTTTLGVGAADVFSVNPSFSGLALPQSRTTARSAKPTPQHPASPEPRNPTNVSPRK
jgi:hypothetical protein